MGTTVTIIISQSLHIQLVTYNTYKHIQLCVCVYVTLHNTKTEALHVLPAALYSIVVMQPNVVDTQCTHVHY